MHVSITRWLASTGTQRPPSPETDVVSERARNAAAAVKIVAVEPGSYGSTNADYSASKAAE